MSFISRGSQIAAAIMTIVTLTVTGVAIFAQGLTSHGAVRAPQFVATSTTDGIVMEGGGDINASSTTSDAWFGGRTTTTNLTWTSATGTNTTLNAITLGRKYLNATTYQILTTDFILSVSSTNNAVTLTLPASTTTNSGFQLIIKDKNGVSETNNITIAGKGSNTIDGGSTAVLNSNYSSITLTSDGANNWEVN